jgi:uroporphyrinogen-III synthase
VVTSPNGARAIVAAAERVFTELSTPRWAAIGHGTAEILEREDVQVDFRPSRPESRVLAEEVPVATGQEVLLLRGDLADGDVLARLVDRGAVVADVVAYRTVEGPRTSRRALREAFADGEPAAVVFASGSAVRGLVSLARAEAVDLAHVPAICIGAETEREATRLGFAVLATSPQPDPETLAATAAEALAEPLEAR